MSKYDGDGKSVQLLPTLLHGGGSGQAAVQEKGKEWGGMVGLDGDGGAGCSKSWDSCHQACIASCTCPKKYQILGNSLVVAFSEPCLKS